MSELCALGGESLVRHPRVMERGEHEQAAVGVTDATRGLIYPAALASRVAVDYDAVMDGTRNVLRLRKLFLLGGVVAMGLSLAGCGRCGPDWGWIFRSDAGPLACQNITPPSR